MADNRQETWQKFPKKTLQELFDAVNVDDFVDVPVSMPDSVVLATRPEVLQRLFNAVDINDVVDAPATLPEHIVLACPDETLQRCFALCLQFWKDGVTRSDLLQLVGKLLRNEELSAEERLQYKYIRAKYKHLRFAQRLYSKDHKSQFLFDLTTRVLGHLQDAFRSGHRSAVLRHGLKLRMLLSKPIWSIVLRSMEHTHLDNEAGFIAYRCAEMRRLKRLIARTTFTGKQFHEIRKIVSMQVSYYDTLRSLVHNDHDLRMSRFLAAINGLMGARHDEMVADALSGRVQYSTLLPLDKEIRRRLETLVASYPL